MIVFDKMEGSATALRKQEQEVTKCTFLGIYQAAEEHMQAAAPGVTDSWSEKLVAHKQVQ